MAEIITFPGRREPDGVLPKHLRTPAPNPGIYLDVLRGSDRIGTISFSGPKILGWGPDWSMIGEFVDVEDAVAFIQDGRRQARS